MLGAPMNLFRRLAPVAVSVCGFFITPLVAHAADFAVLHTFGARHGGVNPLAGLTADAAGTLYGTACSEEIPGCLAKRCSKACGIVFSLANGQEAVLHRFSGADGALPDS